MTFWGVREELCNSDRLRRSYYELLRDELDHFIIQHALIDSYENFQKAKEPYPFVEMRELKPRARIPSVEFKNQNAFLVIFVEDIIPSIHKKYIRFFDVNKTTKTNILQANYLPLDNEFDRNHKFLDSAHFIDFMKTILPVDYALLIQKDQTVKRSRYSLSHFHVRIDWPIADAAEDLGQSLRYISQDIYEKGDKYAEDIQKKLFEYYGLPVMAGGRRTAAIIAAQYLRKLQCISTVYVGSSESRALIRISERGVSKAVLMPLSAKEISTIAESGNISIKDFHENYVVAKYKSKFVCIFLATYHSTANSKAPEDGKLRELNPDLSWLSVGNQQIIPKPGVWNFPPITVNMIYS